MRLLIAALILTLAVAVTASVFAIWPVVGDAPWEDSVPVVQPVDRTEEIRCQAALDLRKAAVEQGSSTRSRTYLAAESEIDRYC